jgi:hypothetical protein
VEADHAEPAAMPPATSTSRSSTIVDGVRAEGVEPSPRRTRT